MAGIISKYMLAEQVKNIVLGGKLNRDDKITLRQAMAVVGQVRNKLIYEELYKRYQVDNNFFIPSSVFSDFTVKSFQKDNGNWYVTLPGQVLSLYKNLGMYRAVVCNDEEYALIPLGVNFKSMYRGFSSSIIEGQKGYIYKGTELELIGIDAEVDVNLTLVLDSYSIEDREDFKFIYELRDELVERAVEILRLQAGLPQDEVLDNKGVDTK